ncbi:MAG: DUF3800 domain-containing protein [Syntrophomonas sp.]
MDEFKAFTDESGNSGLNIFDDNQPYFWTGTVITKNASINNEYLNEWCNICQVQELHGNQLGVGGLEKIAEHISNYISDSDYQFIFTSIEKRHVSSMKFVDTILDSGNNQAVSNIHYGNRGLRLPLALAIANNFSPRDQEEFWNVYSRQDYIGFKQICKRLRWKINNKVPDARIMQLVDDALIWAIDRPKKVLDMKRKELDSPNIVSLSLLMQEIHNLLESDELTRFIHDEQNQFAKFMKQTFGFHKNWVFNTDEFSWFSDVQPTNKIVCEFEIASSDSVFELQLIDIALWLIKRCSERKVDFEKAGNCKLLFDTIFSKSRFSFFSHAQLYQEVKYIHKKVFQLPFDYDSQIKGLEFLNSIETRRKELMNKPVED